ncbi:putative Ubiquitin-like domain superfamily, molecular chaperone regulator BAG [Helianthus annuus]|nr:putative Ubiquitin-like domain superfamily, molecular chaperone regulator BAG [Helianthus annuus]
MPTGLHHEDQKLMYKDKERISKTYLDVLGVKDRSKMVLVEDPISQKKRGISRCERMRRWRKPLNQHPRLAWKSIALLEKWSFCYGNFLRKKMRRKF